MKKIGLLFILMMFFCASFYGLTMLNASSVFGYGYSYGYGYDDNDSDDSDDNDDILIGETKKSSKVKRYKTYQRKYKNDTAKKQYRQIKDWKKGTPEEQAQYFEHRAWYKQYKNLSKSERLKYLTPEEYEMVKQYKRYKGYKEYKKLKKDIGR